MHICAVQEVTVVEVFPFPTELYTVTPSLRSLNSNRFCAGEISAYDFRDYKQKTKRQVLQQLYASIIIELQHISLDKNPRIHTLKFYDKKLVRLFSVYIKLFTLTDLPIHRDHPWCLLEHLRWPRRPVQDKIPYLLPTLFSPILFRYVRQKGQSAKDILGHIP
jgi:predicted membrane-bound spermidine synthase